MSDVAPNGKPIPSSRYQHLSRIFHKGGWYASVPGQRVTGKGDERDKSLRYMIHEIGRAS